MGESEYKKLNIMVKVRKTRRIGVVVGDKINLYNEKMFEVEVGKEREYYKVGELQYISNAKIK